MTFLGVTLRAWCVAAGSQPGTVGDMRITLIGGPADDGFSVPIPMTEPPPYVCVGAEEPYAHYERGDETRKFQYVGECREQEHAFGYPHSEEVGV